MSKSLKATVDQLNQIRLEENRSYADIATQIGIDPGALYKILNGRSDPYDRTLHKIHKFLDEHAEASSSKRRATA